MLRLNKMLFISIILLVFFTSCNNNVATNGGNTITSTTGEIMVSMPSLLSSLDIDRNQSSNSRALLMSEYIEAELYEDGRVVNSIKEYNLFSNISKLGFKMDAEPGEYTLKVNIFNKNYSFDTPIITAESELFTVYAGEETDVYLIGEPTTSTEILIDQSVNFLTEGKKPLKIIKSYEMEDASIISGEEFWYSFTATSEYTEIFIDQNIYESNVFLQLQSEGWNTNIYDNLVIKTTPNTTYYIALMVVDFSDFQNYDYYSQVKTLNEVNFGFKEATLDVDNDNSIETANSVTIGEDTYSVFNEAGDVDFFSVNLEANKEYLLRLESNYRYDMYAEVLDSFGNTTNYINEFEWEKVILSPTEDETIYIKIYHSGYSYLDTNQVKINIVNTAGLPFYIHADIEDYSLYVPGSSIEYIVINSTDGSIVKSFEPLELEDYYSMPGVSLENITDRSNLYVIGVFRDPEGNILYIDSTNIDGEYDESYYIWLNNDLLDITIFSANQYTTVGGEHELFFNSRINNNLVTYLPDTTEITANVKVIEAPVESQLLNTTLTITPEEIIPGEDSLANSIAGSVSFTPDVTGYYTLEVEVTYGDVKLSKEVYFTALKSGEGAEGELNVIFE